MSIAIGNAVSPVFSRAALAGQTYTQKVAAAGDLIAHWILGETSGLTADNAQGVAARDGTYNGAGITLAHAGIGDGQYACDFDGVNGFVNTYSASLATFAPFNEYTIGVWFKMPAAAWTDGLPHYIFSLRTDGANRAIIQKSSADNTIVVGHIGGGTTDTITINDVTDPDIAGVTDWSFIALTVTVSGDMAKAFWGIPGGVIQRRPTATTLGTWVGATLDLDLNNIGCLNNTVPTNPFDGIIGHVMVYGEALPDATVIDLGVVPPETIELFSDDFLTAESAPLTTPRTTEPGGQLADIVDTGNFLSISGGILSASDATASGDPAYWSDAPATWQRDMGLISKIRFKQTFARFYTGFHNAQISAATRAACEIISNRIQYYDTSSYNFAEDSLAADTWYEVAVVVRDSGDYIFLKGGVYTEWTLRFVGNVDAASPLLYANPWRTSITDLVDIDYVRVGYLPSPLNQNDALLTDRLSGAVANATAFSHDADGHIIFTLTTLTGGTTQRISFREQDASNRWEIWITSAGNFELRERIGGTAFARAISAGVLVGGETIRLRFEGDTIKGLYDTTLAWTWTSTGFQTETDGEVINSTTGGGQLSDLEAYSLNPSAAIIEQLDEF
jgi:hypothetical protein